MPLKAPKQAVSHYSTLPEIECIELLENMEEAYAEKFGVPPFNVSHWDPSEEFEKKMLPHIEAFNLSALMPYRFSYQVKETLPVVTKLGGKPNSHYGIFTPSSTTSILCILNWLKSKRRKEIIAVCPAYFSLFHACRRFQLPIHAAYLRRENGAFHLPLPNARIWKKPAVLWLTNPVYGAGVYLPEDDINFVSKLLEDGWTVITDECLALPGRELIRKLGHHSNFMAMYSPHKGICVNGVKFSCVLFNVRHRAFMERWADVWYGGLGCSSSLAISHFLSANFEFYLERFLQAVAGHRGNFDEVCRQMKVEHDVEAKGHFVSCYFPEISTSLGRSREFLEKLVFATGGSIITGNRSRFHRKVGFSFRVNLARGGPLFEPTLVRVIDHLNAYAT